MQKTVTYLYPNIKKASSLKVFQDTSNQILGLYFTRENIKAVEEMPNSKNYAVYFLFNNSQDDESRVYVGQSINGIERIKNHVANKEFWSYCIMFVTDNNSFDKLTIDYLEYVFIKKFKKSSYTLANRDSREKEPNCSIFAKASIASYIDQIDFLLSTEGVVLKEGLEKNEELKLYFPSNKYIGKLYVKDGKFVLCAGSVITRPKEASKEYKNSVYFSCTNLIDGYLRDGKVQEENGQIITLVDLSFKSPTRPAVLMCGYNMNGWTFFKGLDELRGI